MAHSQPQRRLKKIARRPTAPAEAAFRDLVEHSSVGAFIYGDNRFQYVNARLGEILGLPPKTIVQRSLPDLVLPEERQAIETRLRALARPQEQTTFQTRAQKESGFQVHLEVHATRAVLDGREVLLGTVLDVSDRVLTFQHLNEQLEFISAITSGLGEGICSFDENGLVTMVNPAAEEILGWLQYELIGKLLHDYLHPGEARQNCPLRDAHQPVVAVDDEFRRRDRSTVPVSYTLSLLDSAGGQQGGVIIFHDITERKQTEESLRRSEQDYRGLFENARDAILIVDIVREVILDANAQACELYGYLRHELLDMPLDSISTDRSFGTLNLRQVLRDVDSLHFETKQVRKDGAEISVEVSASLVSYKGQPAILAVNRDITERKKIEAEQTRLQNAIKKAALEWQSTFDSIASPIVLVGVDGRIARLNRAARDLAGKDYREVLGLRMDQVGPGEPWQMAAQQIRIAGEAEPVKFCQVVDTLADKTWDLAVTRFGGRGADEERFILVMRDVTEVAKMQESLHRSERMSAMGSLVAGVAHEVRNPLFGMSATLDAFEAAFAAAEYTDYFSEFRQQIDRLNTLMRDLLDYGKPRSVELTPGAIENVIQLAVQEARQASPQVRVESVFEGAVPPMLMERTRMLQVFENLIRNAIQHSSHGTTVTVTARAIHQEDQPWIEAAVLDHGPGFKLEDLPHVFEPFFTRRRGGTGLGLSIVQKIVEEHGGTITAGNRAGGGAMMTVRFPAL
jgi:PAS domain S-box-containing protein